MGQAPSKQHETRLATLELLQNVCEAADRLAASRCGKRSKDVLIQSAALRDMQQQWAERQQQIAELRGDQVFVVATALHTLCNRLEWCQEKLHQPPMMRLHTLSSRHQAAHVLKVLSAAQEAYLNFETAFRLAHVLSRQQGKSGEHGIQGFIAEQQGLVVQAPQPTMRRVSIPVGAGVDKQGDTAAGGEVTSPVLEAAAVGSLARDRTTSHDDVMALRRDVIDAVCSVVPAPTAVTQVSSDFKQPTAGSRDASQLERLLCTFSSLTGTSNHSDVPSADSTPFVWPHAGCSSCGNVQGVVHSVVQGGVQGDVQGDVQPPEHPANSQNLSVTAAGVLLPDAPDDDHTSHSTAESNAGSEAAVWEHSQQGWEDLVTRAWQGDGGAVLACAQELLLGGRYCWQDTSLAIQLLSTAVQQSGNTTACLWLGQLAEQGVGTLTPDRERAAAWYGEGAALGDAQCAVALGYCYQHGFGITQDMQAAEEWYEFAAGCGSASAMNNLAQLALAQQISLCPDSPPAAALDLLARAADQGSQAAWYNLGVCHELGLSGLHGPAAAAAAERCYQQAGSRKALMRLALLDLQQQQRGQLPVSAQLLRDKAVAVGTVLQHCPVQQREPQALHSSQGAALLPSNAAAQVLTPVWSPPGSEYQDRGQAAVSWNLQHAAATAAEGCSWLLGRCAEPALAPETLVYAGSCRLAARQQADLEQEAALRCWQRLLIE